MSESICWTKSLAEQFYAPDGSLRTKRWWNILALPAKHPDLPANGLLLDQVAQTRPHGKQSCLLTSALNALIISGQIGRTQAEQLQDQLVTDSEGKYADHWRPLEGSDHVGWTEDPATLAFFVQEELGTTIGLEHVVSENAASQVAQRLSEGHVAIVRGESVLGSHARIAFEPHGPEYEGLMYVHDPKYTEITGLYPREALPQFQTASTAIIF